MQGEPTTTHSDKTEPLTDEEVLALAYEGQVLGENAQQHARRIFEQHAVAAAKTMCNLAIFSDNERTRLEASRYVVERNLGRLQDVQPEPVEDVFSKLLADCVSVNTQPE